MASSSDKKGEKADKLKKDLKDLNDKLEKLNMLLFGEDETHTLTKLSTSSHETSHETSQNLAYPFIEKIQSNSDYFSGIEFTSDGNIITYVKPINEYNLIIKLWNIDTSSDTFDRKILCKYKLELKEKITPNQELKVSSTNKIAISASRSHNDNYVIFLNIVKENGDYIIKYDKKISVPSPSTAVKKLAFSQDGKYIACGIDEGIYIYDIEKETFSSKIYFKNTYISPYDIYQSSIENFAYSKNEKYIAVTYRAQLKKNYIIEKDIYRVLDIYDVKTAKLVDKINEMNVSNDELNLDGAINKLDDSYVTNNIAFSPISSNDINNTAIIAVGFRSSLRFYVLYQGKLTKMQKLNIRMAKNFETNAHIMNVMFDNTGHKFIVGCSNNMVYIFDVKDFDKETIVPIIKTERELNDDDTVMVSIKQLKFKNINNVLKVGVFYDDYYYDNDNDETKNIRMRGLAIWKDIDIFKPESDKKGGKPIKSNKYTYKGKSYTVRTGSKGGKYILVGSEKKKVYI